LFLARALVEKAEPSSLVIPMLGGTAAVSYLLQAANPNGDAMPIPAIILLDVNMPGIDGFEVLRWVRRNQLLAHIKVVMLSSSESAADIKRATELGAHGYMIKHPNSSLLACVLHQAFGLGCREKAPAAAAPLPLAMGV
jgi:CheY-like chemotaxis protein